MKKSIVSFLFLALLFAACGEKKAPNSETPSGTEPDLGIVIGEKVGLITPANCTREGVLAAYGTDAKVDSIYIIDGMFGEGVVIFPDNPRRRLEVYWDAEFDPKRPAYIRIDGDSSGVSDWKTADGIAIGTPMTEVQKLNGKAFDVSGFGWDFGGFATDWKGGKFNSSLLLRFEPKAADGAPKVSGEGVFASDNPDMVAAKPVVSRLEFRFLADEKLPDCVTALVKADKVDGKMSVFKMAVKGVDHYWLQSGAAAYDGIEFIYDANCKEVCKTGGMRMPMDCMKAYEAGKWELVWEEK